MKNIEFITLVAVFFGDGVRGIRFVSATNQTEVDIWLELGGNGEGVVFSASFREDNQTIHLGGLSRHGFGAYIVPGIELDAMLKLPYAQETGGSMVKVIQPK